MTDSDVPVNERASQGSPGGHKGTCAAWRQQKLKGKEVEEAEEVKNEKNVLGLY